MRSSRWILAVVGSACLGCSAPNQPKPAPTPAERAAPQRPPLPKVDLVFPLRFFEGPRSALNTKDRVYRRQFAARTARCVFTEVVFTRWLGPTWNAPLKVRQELFDEGGASLFRRERMVRLPSSAVQPVLTLGFGEGRAGAWKPGRYRVVVSRNGEPWGEGWFAITGADGQPAPPPVELVEGVTLQSFRLYAGSEHAAAKRRYGTRFSEHIRHLSWEVVVNNALPGRPDRPLPLWVAYYRGDTRAVADFRHAKLEQGRATASYWAWIDVRAVIGQAWAPGQLHAVLYVGARPVAVRRFTVTGPPRVRLPLRRIGRSNAGRQRSSLATWYVVNRTSDRIEITVRNTPQGKHWVVPPQGRRSWTYEPGIYEVEARSRSVVYVGRIQLEPGQGHESVLTPPRRR